jgi:hypothetical protein
MFCYSRSFLFKLFYIKYFFIFKHKKLFYTTTTINKIKKFLNKINIWTLKILKNEKCKNIQYIPKFEEIKKINKLCFRSLKIENLIKFVYSVKKPLIQFNFAIKL